MKKLYKTVPKTIVLSDKIKQGEKLGVHERAFADYLNARYKRFNSLTLWVMFKDILPNKLKRRNQKYQMKYLKSIDLAKFWRRHDRLAYMEAFIEWLQENDHRFTAVRADGSVIFSNKK